MDRKEFLSLPRGFRQYINELYLQVKTDLVDYKNDKVMYERTVGQKQMLLRLFGDNLSYRFEVGDKVITNHPYVSEHGEIVAIVSVDDVKVKLLDGQVVSCPISKLELWDEPEPAKEVETQPTDNIDWEARRFEFAKAILTSGKYESLFDVLKQATSMCEMLKP